MYLRAFDGKEPDPEKDAKRDLRYHFLSHMALDYVLTQLQYSDSTRDYALLLIHDGIAVYGCLTNTGVKILVGTDAHENVRFDLRTTLRSIQKAYIGYVCNPFHDPDSEAAPIQSKALDQQITNVVTSWNSAARF